MKRVVVAVVNLSTLKIMDNLNQKNHFQKFNLAEAFDLDLEDLEQKYLIFQHNLHPDKFVNNSKEEQLDLEYNSILINEAYKILKNPLKRAIYLLKIKGFDVEGESSPIKPNQEILTKILQLREEIFDSDNHENLNKIKSDCQIQIKNILQKAKESFCNNNYASCAQMVIEAKYLDKAIEEIKEKIKK